MLSPRHAPCVARRQGEALAGASIGQPLSGCQDLTVAVSAGVRALPVCSGDSCR